MDRIVGQRDGEELEARVRSIMDAADSEHTAYIRPEASFKPGATVPSCPVCPGEARSIAGTEEGGRWSFTTRFITAQLAHSYETVRLYKIESEIPARPPDPAEPVVSFDQAEPAPAPTTSLTQSHGAHYTLQTITRHKLVEESSVMSMIRYRFTSRFSGGVEYDPRLGHWSPIASLIAVTEARRRPAVVLGVNSDRIGLPSGQSFNATVSKNLTSETGLPIAPYAGLTFGTYEHRLRPIGGLNVAFTQRLGSLVIYDGVHVHQMINFTHHRSLFSLILVRGRKPGLAYNIVF